KKVIAQGLTSDQSEGHSKTRLLLPPLVTLEQPAKEETLELWVVRDLLVELEVRADHLLNLVVSDVIEGQPGVLRDVHLDARLQGRVAGQFLLQLLDEYLVILGEVRPEAVVQGLEDLRQSFHLPRG